MSGPESTTRRRFITSRPTKRSARPRRGSPRGTGGRGGALTARSPGPVDTRQGDCRRSSAGSRYQPMSTDRTTDGTTDEQIRAGVIGVGSMGENHAHLRRTPTRRTRRRYRPRRRDRAASRRRIRDRTGRSRETLCERCGLVTGGRSDPRTLRDGFGLSRGGRQRTGREADRGNRRAGPETGRAGPRGRARLAGRSYRAVPTRRCRRSRN